MTSARRPDCDPFAKLDELLREEIVADFREHGEIEIVGWVFLRDGRYLETDMRKDAATFYGLLHGCSRKVDCEQPIAPRSQRGCEDADRAANFQHLGIAALGKSAQACLVLVTLVLARFILPGILALAVDAIEIFRI
ncbi:MAG: hypothetical protein WB992_25690 [Bryobacteraceae bacterium]